MVRRRIFAEGVTQQQLLQRDCGLRIADCGLKAEGARAQAADRARGDFEDKDAVRVDAALGVDRTVMEAQRSRRARHAVDDGALRVGVRGRRRQVDRFLEERAVERIGLVEDRQHLEGAAMHHPFESVFAAGNEPFDERGCVRVVPFGAHLRLLHQRPQALERGGQGRDRRRASRRGCRRARPASPRRDTTRD